LDWATSSSLTLQDNIPGPHFVIPEQRGLWVLDGGGETLQDPDTLLWWTRRPVGGDPITWEDALGSCANWTGDEQRDWRVPSLHELLSLVDLNWQELPPPFAVPAFDNEQSRVALWSSTALRGPAGESARWGLVVSDAMGGDEGWTLEIQPLLSALEAGEGDKAFSLCVRGGVSDAAPLGSWSARWQTSDPSTVRDTWTNLTWMREAWDPQADPPMGVEPPEPAEWCADQGEGWRLPTLYDLWSIFNVQSPRSYEHAELQTPDGALEVYVSSTPVRESGDDGVSSYWMLDFEWGGAFPGELQGGMGGPEEGGPRVRCVQGPSE